MLKQAFLLCCLLSFSASGFSQVKFNPKGIVLYPFEKVVAEALRDSVNSYRGSVEITDEVKKQFITPYLPPNWKIVREKELGIMAHQNYFSLLSLQVEREINYKLIENYSHALITVSKDSSKADVVAYKKLVTQHSVDWIINIHSVAVSKADGKLKLDVKFQVYYHPLGYTLLQTALSFTEQELTDCNDRVLSCLMITAAQKMAALTVDKIERVR